MKGVRKKMKEKALEKMRGQSATKTLISTVLHQTTSACVCVCVCVCIGNSVPSVINDTFYFFTHSIQMYKCISIPCNTCKTKCKKLEINFCPNRNPRLLHGDYVSSRTRSYKVTL